MADNKIYFGETRTNPNDKEIDILMTLDIDELTSNNVIQIDGENYSPTPSSTLSTVFDDIVPTSVQYRMNIGLVLWKQETLTVATTATSDDINNAASDAYEVWSQKAETDYEATRLKVGQELEP